MCTSFLVQIFQLPSSEFHTTTWSPETRLLFIPSRPDASVGPKLLGFVGRPLSAHPLCQRSFIFILSSHRTSSPFFSCFPYVILLWLVLHVLTLTFTTTGCFLHLSCASSRSIIPRFQFTRRWE